MASPSPFLSVVLDRLKRENLHGPISPFSQEYRQKKQQQQQQDDWQFVSAASAHGGEEGIDDDLDAKDPRWIDLFKEYFLEWTSESHDDLLFFVRQRPLDPPSQEPIFVRRKVGAKMPELCDIVAWKPTFFLNLIVQLSCILTVAICKRAPSMDQASSKSLLNNIPSTWTPSAQQISDPLQQPSSTTPSSSSSSTPSQQNQPNLPQQQQADSNSETKTATKNTTNSSTTASSSSSSKSRMMALKRVTKKVYSAPYKSRMDVKDAFMNECSFPLVYYTVNDYELHELHLPIKEKTYLCVELSVVVSTSETTQHLQAADAIAAIGLDQDRTPFPVPDGFEKVVLFQGAVPYTSLLDIYCQKGISGSTTLAGTSPQQKSSSLWGNRGGGGTTSSTDNLAAERVEYIMMRGPHGKGSCQVAIRDADAFRNAINSNNNAADSSNQRQQQSSLSSSSFSSSKKDGEKTAAWGFLKSLGNTVKNQLVSAANSFGNDGSGSNDSLQAAAEMEFKKPDELMCSMTYVTMPWQSIISDLIAVNKKV